MSICLCRDLGLIDRSVFFLPCVCFVFWQFHTCASVTRAISSPLISHTCIPHLFLILSPFVWYLVSPCSLFLTSLSLFVCQSWLFCIFWIFFSVIVFFACSVCCLCSAISHRITAPPLRFPDLPLCALPLSSSSVSWLWPLSSSTETSRDRCPAVTVGLHWRLQSGVLVMPAAQQHWDGLWPLPSCFCQP